MTSDDDDRVAYLAHDRADGAPGPLDDAEGLDDLRALLADPGLWGEPPAHLEDDVVAAVSSRAAAPPSASPAPATLDERRRRRSGRRVPPAAWLAAAAAAIVVVAGIAAASLAGGGGDDGPTFAAALAPTDLAPGASGEAVATRTDSGWRIELDATGLPRLDGGAFYEAWLRGPDDVLVPVGTFNEGADVVLWAGVSPADFTAFTVTREAADGDQASSGERVLAGPLERRD
jgi:hypothetical protein